MERFVEHYLSTPMTSHILEALKASFHYCEQIVKKSGSNFYFGMLLTPQPKREAVYAIYAWMREIDDIADNPDSNHLKHQKLLAYYKKTRRLIQNKIALETIKDKHWLAFYKTIHDYAIPLKYFREMVIGQLQVVHKKPIETFQQLYRYCYRVASTVGLILIHIWGYRGGIITEKMAEHRGISFQLINILRDVIQDEKDGITYIPTELRDEKSIDYLIKNDKKTLDKSINFILSKIEEYFKSSESLEKFVQKDGFISLRIMSEFYHEIFKKIRKNPYLSLNNNKIKLNFTSKLFLILKIYFFAKTTRMHYRYE